MKMSETQRDNSNSFVIQKSNEHIQSLTPINVSKNPQIGQISASKHVQKNSIGGLHTIDHDYSHTQQQFNPSKTQTSFGTTTTSPQLYNEVPRPSILNILNQQEKLRQQSSRTVIVGNYQHKSLNSGSRKAEHKRIQYENYKMLL